jgi:serine/threonine-protein kinase
LGRSVFIKALAANILPSSPFGATLAREARLLAELSHPNILQVHDFVQEEARLWLVLEYVDGYTLADLLHKRVSISPQAALCIGLGIIRALGHAHARGIVHRDIQPRNVWVAKDGVVKLAHFAVATDGRMPTFPELLDGAEADGPAYCSPEQILGEPPDPRSDLFSLGAVLYELVSQKRAFGDGDGPSVTQRIRHEAPTPLSRVVDNLPASFERAIFRCLEKLPSDRFSSALELEGALRDTGLLPPGQSARAVIVEFLEGVGLADKPETASSAAPSVIPPRQLKQSMWPALNGLFVALFLIVLGGGAIQFVAYKRGELGHARRSSTRLELAPAKGAQLRVVVTPWARVSVDGQFIDTTPFAWPIPLSAGTHYVTLEHPKAPAERRTVSLSPGETILLDVKMDVPLSEKPAPAASASAAPKDTSP